MVVILLKAMIVNMKSLAYSLARYCHASSDFSNGAKKSTHPSIRTELVANAFSTRLMPTPLNTTGGMTIPRY